MAGAAWGEVATGGLPPDDEFRKGVERHVFEDKALMRHLPKSEHHSGLLEWALHLNVYCKLDPSTWGSLRFPPQCIHDLPPKATLIKQCLLSQGGAIPCPGILDISPHLSSH